MMRTANPALNAKTFTQARDFGTGETMTLQGTVNKSFVLLGLLLLTASWVWGKVFQPVPLIGDFEALAAAASTPALELALAWLWSPLPP